MSTSCNLISIVNLYVVNHSWIFDTVETHDVAWRCSCANMGQGSLLLTPPAPSACLVSAVWGQRQLSSASCGVSACERVSCCFTRGTEWVANLKIVSLSLLCSDCCLSKIAKHGHTSVYHISPFPPLIDNHNRCCSSVRYRQPVPTHPPSLSPWVRLSVFFSHDVPFRYNLSACQWYFYALLSQRYYVDILRFVVVV